MLGFLRRWKADLSGRETEAQVPTAWRVHAGLAHPDWGRLGPVDPGGWLKHLQAQVGADFRLDRSRNFHLLSPFTARKASYQIQFLELSLGRLSRLLGVDSRGSHVVLIWRNPDEYWRYISHYTGSSGGSMGMCIRAATVHLVTYDCDVNMLQATLAHELVHDLLSQSELPLWLEEGIAQTFCTSGLEGISKGAQRLRELAQAGGLDDFWSGRGFSGEEDQQKFCYALAEILTRLLLDEKNFRTFLSGARRADCGQEACRQAFGRSLGAFLETFLGPGVWEPSASQVHEIWALLHESRWDRAVEVAGSSEDSLVRLGRAIALSETARWREGLAELARLPCGFKSVDVLMREFWLQLCTEDPECSTVLEQLGKLNHPTESLRGAWMYSLGRYQEARASQDWAAWAAWKLGERLDLAGKRDFNSLLLQVEFYLEDRELERALLLVKECLQLTSEDITTWQLLGRISEGRGQAEEARRAYRRCVEIFDHRGRCWKPERERVDFARERLGALGSGTVRSEGEIGFEKPED